MSLFAIGDVHLSLGADKPMDVFRGWQDYVNRLETQWKRVVEPGDTVVIPGDISWAMRLPDALADLEFLNRLPGEKILLKGNHDLWWETMKKMNGFLETHQLDRLHFLHNNCYDCGPVVLCGSRGWFFEEDGEDTKVLLREVGRLTLSLEAAKTLDKEPIVFFHYPPVCADRVCRELVDVLVSYGVRRCYYGHLHGPAIAGAVQGEVDGITYRLVSGDALGFCPHLIEKF